MRARRRLDGPETRSSTATSAKLVLDHARGRARARPPPGVVHAFHVPHADRRAVRSPEPARRRPAREVARDRRGRRPGASGGGARRARRGHLACGARGGTRGVIVGASGCASSAGFVPIGPQRWCRAPRRIARTGDVEVAFWDVAGEQVHSAAAAGYYSLLAHLVEARRRRAETQAAARTRFAPDLDLQSDRASVPPTDGSPYERMRQLLPLFAALDQTAARADDRDQSLGRGRPDLAPAARCATR